MTTAFQYRPKFVDIRVNKPDPARADRKPDDRPCDHIGCGRAGSCRAPKGRERQNEFWWFCADHAAEYNRQWNYFAGMSADDLAAFERESAVGHRPTWTFKAAPGDRESAARRKFEAFRFENGDRIVRPQPEQPRLSRIAAMALETLQLEETAKAAEIRARYAELVKRFHPDMNGGDRSAEAQLHKVIRAFQTLKSAGMTA